MSIFDGDFRLGHARLFLRRHSYCPAQVAGENTLNDFYYQTAVKGAVRSPARGSLYLVCAYIKVIYPSCSSNSVELSHAVRDFSDMRKGHGKHL